MDISRTGSHFKIQHGINEQHRRKNSEKKDIYTDKKNRSMDHETEHHGDDSTVTTHERKQETVKVTSKMPVVDVDTAMQNNAKNNEYSDDKLLERQGVILLGNKSKTVQWLHEDIKITKEITEENKKKDKESTDEMFTQKITPVNLKIYSSKHVQLNDGTVHAVALAGKDSKSGKLQEGSLHDIKYSSVAMTTNQNKTNKLFHVNENFSRTLIGEDDSNVKIKPLGQETLNGREIISKYRKNKTIQMQSDIRHPDYLVGEKSVDLIIDDRNGFKLMDTDHYHQSADPNRTDVHIIGNVDTNPVNSVAKEGKFNQSQNETNKDGGNAFSTANVSTDKIDLSQASMHEHIIGKLLSKVDSNASLSNKEDKKEETGKFLDKGNMHDKIFSTGDLLTTVPVNLDGKDLLVNGVGNQTGKMEPDGTFQPGKELVAKSAGKQDLTGENDDDTDGQSGNLLKKNIIIVNEKKIFNIHKSPVSIIIAVIVLAVAVVIIASVIKRKYCSRSKNSGYHQLPWDVDIEDIEMHPQYKIT
ncbi:hypothetical protein CHS0354_014798 [Potamilus streckersoni]|uniref:Uncharacterized protein n=1 Tax=Potamilus streckersoni TaxID=2493646 RepID=A0AAE0W0U2_9BIVA|nr:hypothetical protein CHS0354_014798 [Potamilus streckersoni]